MGRGGGQMSLSLAAKGCVSELLCCCLVAAAACGWRRTTADDTFDLYSRVPKLERVNEEQEEGQTQRR